MRGLLRQHMALNRTSRNLAHGVEGIIPAIGTHGENSILEIRQQLLRGRHVGGGLVFFQRPLLLGRVQLAEIVDAGIGLRGCAGFYEVGNRDRRQEADDGHNDHDFHQREAGLAEVFHCLHVFTFFFARREPNDRRVMMITALFTLIARRNRNWVIIAAPMPKPKLNPDLRFASKVVKNTALRSLPARIHENYCPQCPQFAGTVFFWDTETVLRLLIQNGASCRDWTARLVTDINKIAETPVISR